ncbi:MAG: SoxR reducing system RseC family protein [Methylophilaceae bacterium]
MIEEQAVVIRTEGEQAFLEIQRNQPCGLCGATQGCGISLWSRIFSSRRNTFSSHNQLDVKPGERVVVGVEEGALLTGSLVAYALPLLLLCIGALLGSNLAETQAGKDLYAALGALLGLFVGLASVRVYTAAQRTRGRYQPVMLRRA